MKFEKVSLYKDVDFPMPVRKTSKSAGYDIAVAEDTLIQPYNLLRREMEDCYDIDTYSLKEIAEITKTTKAKPTLVPTGVKCELDDDKYLELSVRSSAPLKHWLIMANGVGIIDSDYYNNVDNEGHIFFQIINLSPFPILLKKGDIIGQGIIKKYEVTENDKAEGERVGGFGSTSE